MKRSFFNLPVTKLLFSVLALCLLHPAFVVLAQKTNREAPPSQSDEVIRINTELVQTDVMVFDKKGRFVEGLAREDFELTLSGKQRPVSFFERITTGSQQEATQVSTARRGPANQPLARTEPATTNSSRVILFFVDDVHLKNESLARVRKALLEFVDTRMRESDQVAIVSTSGQIGFLQQLTENEAVLHEAVARLNYKRNPETYAGKTVITDFDANQVAEHGDRDLFNYLVSSTINEYQLVASRGGDPRGLDQVAVNNVKNRVRQVNAQARAVTSDTLGVLMSLMRSSSQLPGRKLLFFVSDGFITDVRGSSAMTLLKRVTEMAARVGIVAYTMEATGTYSSPEVEANRNDFPDGLASGTPARNPSTESSAMREPLSILAEDTGGRAFFNSNSIPDSIQQAIEETSDYYLLAWSPDTDEERKGKARLRVSIKNRPDLKVRLRRNYYVPPVADTTSKKTEETTESGSAPAPAPDELKPEVELLTTLGSPYPKRTLPTTLSIGYLNTPDQGLVLKLSMQLERWAFNFEQGADSQKRLVDIIGAAIDDRGVIVSFKQVLTVTANLPGQQQGLPIVWNQQLRLPPGLYQVRVALRERDSGRTGSAFQWIEVPNPSDGRLMMSSLFLGERKTNAQEQKTTQSLLVNVTHRFARSSVIRYQTYIYNGRTSNATPDIDIQTYVQRGGQTIITMPPGKVPVEGLAANVALPYWAEVPTTTLSSGAYLLRVTATDRVTKTSTTQIMRFVVE